MLVGGEGLGAVGDLTMGEKLLKNLLFLNVSRPVPSTLTVYWSCSFASTSPPVLSHLLGWLPTWFCMKTFVPIARVGNFLVCSDQDSWWATCLLARAFSLCSSSSFQVLWGCGEEGLAIQPLSLSKIWWVKGMILPFSFPTVTRDISCRLSALTSCLPMKVAHRSRRTRTAPGYPGGIFCFNCSYDPSFRNVSIWMSDLCLCTCRRWTAKLDTSPA